MHWTPPIIRPSSWILCGSEENMNRVAVFIDADNISAFYAEEIMKKAEEFGEIVICRAYGNFSAFSGEKSWKEAIRMFAIQAFPQVSVADNKKNNADFILMLDALEAALSNNIGSICIASSDSDFLPLVQRLRPKMTIYGFGEEKTLIAYRMAFTKFFILEETKQKESNSTATDQQNQTSSMSKTAEMNEHAGTIVSPAEEDRKLSLPLSDTTSVPIPKELIQEIPLILTPRQALLIAYEIARQNNSKGNDYCTKTAFGAKMMQLMAFIPSELQCSKGLLAKLLKIENCQDLFTEYMNGTQKVVSLSQTGVELLKKEKEVIDKIVSIYV